ncbi:helix-turn-helix domain-containing protein [Qipengyuania sp.]|uniref:helix-turn-helix domain-containing protein n=1 Tax=Qipengyuania sp. TaxID=2004515 RepID=UPI0035C7AF5B
MGRKTLRARFFHPPQSLAGCFTSFYLLEVDLPEGRFLTDALHPEWGNLRFFQGALPETRRPDGAMLKETPFTATGPSAHPTAFRLPKTRMWGIGLLPLGWAKFIEVPASELADSVSDGMQHPAFIRFRALQHALENAEAESEEAQAEIICDHFLALDRPLRDKARICAVHEALIDPEVRSPAQLASQSAMTPRTLERMCARYFGFPPQLLIRRQRMMRTLAAFMLAEKTTWSQVIDLHYTDHAHFTREFHAFMCMSPSEYAAMEHPVLGAFMAERERQWGSPVQTLDAPQGPGTSADSPKSGL